MLNLEPIEIISAKEKVCSQLRKAIFSREIAEGTELILESIATSLGVSVTPVREALQVLQRDGLIEYKKK
ncbi:GntR family transcriptional regulator [Treponema phagedenis]|uniref:FCD domain protein n=1 Tax=Treponema phagedenis TaxID=162 RepID=A0A0B7H0Q0_TREPH|nr:GntR family transcriptional regulator [Treponema phagedenis]NVP25486.1 GntR family transcriptional regulator [Treponema phagedenis]QEJ93963.1 GntR family transcriptional regulator [Treponema phagedenis]QEJ96715.1 GntR family transcriptional regulator [Treponema phagedenis]QEJ96789.1 GntR family transcriptional regulator [Treponema phagedenis]QEJ96875.1 GntR family transcriptional regulator [Treponema phagedenis]